MRHRNGSYPVFVGADLADVIRSRVTDAFPGCRIAIISDTTVAAVLPFELPDAITLTFPAGERHKTRESWTLLTDALLEHRLGRDTVIVARGGGVTTDLGGFVAATFLRGVPWIAIPTTTLGMIDAAIGGKTGVDVGAGKNLVGAFHHPSAVIADIGSLVTLPQPFFRQGLAEAVKHAAILDARHGKWILDNAARIVARDETTLVQLVHRSAELKGGVVSGDENEHGPRTMLNAGHTIAHALELVSDYAISHGDAVAIGLVAETRLAERIGRCRHGASREIEALLEALGLPTEIPDGISVRELVAPMTADKKNRAGAIRMALISTFGNCEPVGGAWSTAITPAQLAAIG